MHGEKIATGRFDAATLGRELAATLDYLAPRLERMAARFGVPVPKDIWSTPPAPKEVGVSRAVLLAGASDATALAEALDGLDGVLASPGAEVGIPGTRISSGILGVEPNANMAPYLARGVSGWGGVYDELIREPVVYKSLATLTNLIKSGVFKVHVPDELADHPALPEIEAAASQVWGRLSNIEGGWSRFVENLCSAIAKGFATFEVVYGQETSGKLYVRKLAFREQAITNRWILDGAGRSLVAIEYATAGQYNKRWCLPTRGPTLAHTRALVASVGRVGNNFEGLPPLRTVRLLVEYKKLLLAIMAASTERYGCPILQLQAHEGLYRDSRARPNDAQWSDFFDIMQYLQALDTPVIRAPFGLTASFLSPDGTAPDFVPLLQWFDSAIASVFATQAQQLGHSTSSGSYALASVQDDDLMRAAPAFAQTLLEPVNELFKAILRTQYGLQTVHLPSLIWTPREVEDTSRWLADLAVLSAMAGSLPPEILRIASGKLGISPDAWEVTPDVDTEPMTPVEEDSGAP